MLVNGIYFWSIIKLFPPIPDFDGMLLACLIRPRRLALGWANGQKREEGNVHPAASFKKSKHSGNYALPVGAQISNSVNRLAGDVPGEVILLTIPVMFEGRRNKLHGQSL